MQKIEEQLEIDSNSTRIIITNISNKSLKTSAEMFIYLNTCTAEDLVPWFDFYKDLFDKKPPGLILLTLNRMLKNTTSSQIKDLRAIVINF